jgi:hypothetical protein
MRRQRTETRRQSELPRAAANCAPVVAPFLFLLGLGCGDGERAQPAEGELGESGMALSRAPAHSGARHWSAQNQRQRHGHRPFRRGHGKPHHGGHDRCEVPVEEEPSSCGAPLAFQRIAADGDRAGSLIGSALPAIDAAGRVALAGSEAGAARLLLGSGGPLSAIDVAAGGLGEAARVALDDDGRLLFSAPFLVGDRFGVFSADSEGGAFAELYSSVTCEPTPPDDGCVDASSRIGLSHNGIAVFSSIRSGRGALFRGPIDGPIEVLQTAGTFFNNQELDVNAAGAVAIQMEHSACGLQRGILVFDTPEVALADAQKAFTGTSVGQQPDTAINDAGVVAFALRGTAASVEVLRCPPGETAERFSVVTGVYSAAPTPYFDPASITLLADNGGPFASFGAVELDNAGNVVFEATLDNGESGIFSGPDPIADKIIVTGDSLDGELVTLVQLGQINQSCQIAFAVESAAGRSVWRASGVAR